MDLALEPPLHHAANEIAEWLTWDQICERYPDQFVCLIDVDWVPQSADVRTARVGLQRVTNGKATHWLGDLTAFERISDEMYGDVEHFVRFTGPPLEIIMRPRVIVDDELRELLHPRR